MSGPVEILGSDYPVCAEPECRKLAQDGYCLASCCAGSKRAHCNEHSHRPQLVLDSFGFAADKAEYSREEVLRVVRSMWMGAGLVIEAAGHFAMLRDLRAKRLEVGCDACRDWTPPPMSKVVAIATTCQICGRVLRAKRGEAST